MFRTSKKKKKKKKKKKCLGGRAGLKPKRRLGDRAGLKPIRTISPNWAARPILQALVQVDWEPGPTEIVSIWAPHLLRPTLVGGGREGEANKHKQFVLSSTDHCTQHDAVVV